MSFWKKLFGGSPAPAAKPTQPKPITPEPPKSVAPAQSTNVVEEAKDIIRIGDAQSAKTYRERDNVGTRYETAEEIQGYSLARDLPGSGFSVETIGSPLVTTFSKDPQARKKIPFIYYYFYVGPRDGKADAIAAMTELPCFKIATDSGKLISTEVLDFGLYSKLCSDGSGKIASWSVFVGGAHLSLELYEAAINSFKKHHGNEKRVSGPPAPSKASQTTVGKAPTSVTFVREEHPSIGGRTATKKIYTAPSKASALVFLQGQTVSKPFTYIEVDTPEGRFGKDMDGIYG